MDPTGGFFLLKNKIVLCYYLGMQKYQNQRLRLNNQIRVPEVRVIDVDGKMLGTMPTYDALRLANEKRLDLVEVGPSAKPPVAKIMDYGKYMYQKERKEKSGKPSKSPAQELKTVRVGLKTGPHDLGIKAQQADKFLAKGHRVRIELPLRGREKGLAHLGHNKLEEFLKIITPKHAVEEPIRRGPWGLGLLIKPSK